jgi:outer membrane protein assembly factor BamB
MKTSDLIFVGIKGTAIALERTTGKQVWATHLKGSNFVNVLLQGEQVLATTSGEVFCLNALNGDPLWNNPLTGFGLGLATISTAFASPNASASVLAEEMNRQERQHASAAGAAAATM